MEHIKRKIIDAIEIFNKLLNDKKILTEIDKISSQLIRVSRNKKKIFFAGNGGSAADSQHLAAELVGRFEINRKAIAAQSLTTDTSILTAVGNDFSFNDIFSRQIQALGEQGDALLIMSTSGKSQNIINALETAREKSLLTIALLGGFDSKIIKLCDYIIQVPSKNTARIQEAHILIGHIICGIIENSLFNENLKSKKD